MNSCFQKLTTQIVVTLTITTVLLFAVCGPLKAQAWNPLFSTPPTALDGNVNALLMWDDGSGPDLIAGGDFVTAGWQEALRIARWDGVAWTPLGVGFDGAVRALTVYNGELIATGDFVNSAGRAVNRIARWDGTQWQPLGAGLNNRGRTLLVSNGRLYVGGQFTNAGGQLVNRVAVWDGIDWAPMAAGFGNEIRSLAIFGDSVHAGGLMGVARWDGNGWQPLGDLGGVFALTTYGGALFAGGNSGSKISRWNGASWEPLTSGIESGTDVRSLASHNNELVVGGTFTRAGGVDARNLAFWNGQSWSSTGSGVQAGVASTIAGTLGINALVVDGQTLVVGGEFALAGGLGATSVARWEPASGWTSFATGIGDEVSTIQAQAGQIVVGGRFTSVPGLPQARSIAAWDGNNWSALGSGFPENEAAVSRLGEYNGEVIAAGGFLRAGSIEANGIARWNGTQWRTMGAGLQGITGIATLAPDLVINAGNSWLLWDGNDYRPMVTPAPNVGSRRCLKVYDNALYACVGSQVVRYSNGAWTVVGSSFGSEVWDVHVHAGELYASGFFASGVARWTGTNWVAVGNLSDYGVTALNSWDGKLVGAGLQQFPGLPPPELTVKEFVNGGWRVVGVPLEQPRFPALGGKLVFDLESWNGRLVANGIFSGTASRRAVNLIAFGPVINTTVDILSIQPRDPAPGQTAIVTVRVQSNDGAPVGGVSITGVPRGACSTMNLMPAVNHAIATCSITIDTIGPAALQAAYSGGSQGSRTWAASRTNVAATIAVGDRLFSDGFEGS
jgi:hypothetical protein